jgi:hypothetical protein
MSPPIHPICRLFPAMPEEELNRLAEDIRRRGELLEPIVLYQGAVLDGRHRLQACELAGVPARFTEWAGEGSPIEWVIARNLHRRHFSASQRAVLALQVLPHLQAEAKARMREGARRSRGAQICAPLEAPPRRRKITAAGEAARLLGASPRYVQAARRLNQICPSLLPLVAAGRMSLCQALRAANLDGGTLRRVQEKIAAAPANEDISLRRLIYHARDYSDVFHTIKPWSQIEAERAASPPAAPPRFYHFQTTLDSDTIAALDRGEIIHACVANRWCVVRLRDLPTAES